jgi:hypothetical protein
MYKIKIEVPHIGGRIEKTSKTSFPTIRVIGQELFLSYVIVKKIELNSGWIATTKILNVARNFRPKIT